MKDRKNIKKVFINLIFIIGFLICLYPLISSIISGYYQKSAIATYNKSINNIEVSALNEDISKAENYNSTLYNYNKISKDRTDIAILKEYENILNVGDGIMGSIDIPSIGVNLPIYHGTSEEVLTQGAGHVEGSSLPIGGINTRSLLSAHTGLPTSKLFTSLDELVIGDLFFIRIQNETLAYKVRDIKIIDPEDIESLKIEDGKDLVSLITCTPYGLNTHRLIVTGERVAYEVEEYSNIEKKAMSIREMTFTILPFAFLGIVIILKIKDKRINKNIQ